MKPTNAQHANSIPVGNSKIPSHFSLISSAICVDCFNAGNHTGHNCTFHYRNHLIHLVKRIKVAGGVCDCGDFQAWKPSGFCPKHRGISDEEDSLPPFFRDALRQIIIEILTYLNGVLSEIQDLDEDLKNDFSIRDAIMVTEWLEEFFKRGNRYNGYIFKR